MVGNKIVLCGS